MNRLASQRRSIETITMGAVESAWGMLPPMATHDLTQVMLKFRDHPPALVRALAADLTTFFTPSIRAMIVANLADEIERGL